MTSPLAHAPVILLVQPAHDDRDMYAEYLRLHDLTAICSDDAVSALASAERADVVVTALRLPGTDGLELIRRLRDGARTKHIPIIVLTSLAWQTYRDRAEAAGCDAFLAKPCVPDTLLAELRRLLALRSIPKPRPARASPRERRRRRES
jgi:two-component system, cell cycle response regulator DivK